MDDSTEPALLGAVCQSESDAEMAAFLTQAAESARLEWTLPPCPGLSRLDGSWRPSSFLPGNALGANKIVEGTFLL